MAILPTCAAVPAVRRHQRDWYGVAGSEQRQSFKAMRGRLPFACCRWGENG